METVAIINVAAAAVNGAAPVAAAAVIGVAAAVGDNARLIQ